MDEYPKIPEPPDASEHTAFMVVEQFTVYYQPTLSQVEFYLEELTRFLDSPYTAPYHPWKEAMHELNNGLQCLKQHSPLPNRERFHDALQMLSFNSACSFVRDACISCKIPVKPGFATRLHENLQSLLKAVDVLAPA